MMFEVRNKMEAKIKYVFQSFLDLFLLPKKLFYKFKLARIKKEIEDFKIENEAWRDTSGYILNEKKMGYEKLRENAYLYYCHWVNYELEKVRNERLDKYLKLKHLGRFDEKYRHERKTSKFLV